jgi:cobalt-precorrin 5A hydrolase
MKIGVLAVTAGGRELARGLAAGLAGAEMLDAPAGVVTALARNWGRFDGFVCIMAAGIAVRAVAPLLADKASDPCVVVVDEKGEHAISLLSGHLGGGNDLARRVAALTGGTAVITTASEVRGLAPIDLWAAAQDLVADSREVMTRASAILVNQGRLRLYPEVEVASLPPGLLAVARPEEADLIVSRRTGWPQGALLFRPRELVVGVGCNRGVSVAELNAALDELLADHGLSRLAVRNLASIDLKRDEEGLLLFAREQGWRLDWYSKDELNQVDGIVPAAAVMRATGAQGVAEPAALLSAASDKIMIRKRKWKNVTLALVRASFTLSARVRGDGST